MLTEEKIIQNWEEFIEVLNLEFSENPKRLKKLLSFYNNFEDRIGLMPASGNKNYHNAVPGGYIDHILRVYKVALRVNSLWNSLGFPSTFTREELVFTALHHDLGKFGSLEHEMYLENDNEWEIKNRGKIYKINSELQFMTIPDRGLLLLSQLQISLSENEYLTIKLHDGLYEDINKPYFVSHNPDSSLRSNLVYVIHQADFIASKMEKQGLQDFEITDALYENQDVLKLSPLVKTVIK